MIKELESISATITPHPNYIAQIDERNAEKLINNKIKKTLSILEQLNNKKILHTQVKKTLDDINSLLRCIDHITRNVHSKSLTISLTNVRDKKGILDISAHTIFESGCNIAIYGDAGAGKSTTLHVYAESLYSNKEDADEVLFIPLNRVCNKVNKLGTAERTAVISKSDSLESFINAYLLFKDVSLSESNKNSFLEHLQKKRKVTVIIDALDEAANHSDWIVEAITALPKAIRGAQVIVSSRNNVKSIRNIEFLGITLLPFTKDQLKTFIFGWLNNDQQKEELWNSIKDNSLFEVAKNPLLATIICTLHKSGMPVPRNEAEVYRKYVELLCGLYDQHKEVKRTQVEKSILEKCCAKIAYQMHCRQQREATLEEITNYLSINLESKFTPELIVAIIEDLINGCNILIHSIESDTYSFGHLRIQEYLASEEISRNRAVDIVGLSMRDWWNGAFALYSYSNDIQPLIDEIYDRRGNFKQHAKALRIMIRSQPTNLQGTLLKLVDRHDKIDTLDGYNQLGIMNETKEIINHQSLNELLGYD